MAAGAESVGVRSGAVRRRRARDLHHEDDAAADGQPTAAGAGQPQRERNLPVPRDRVRLPTTADRSGASGLPVHRAALGVPVAPPTGTILPILAGPSALRAWSPIPGQIDISWSVVSSATRYRIVRSIVGFRNTKRELGPSLAVHDALGGYTGNQYIDVPVNPRWTYAYTVYAYVKPGATEVLTAGSPVATAKSMPFVQVPGVTYTVVPYYQRTRQAGYHASLELGQGRGEVQRLG